MRIFLKIVIIFFFFDSFSQNLVPNPSFEYYSSCPTGCCQLTNAIPWIANEAEYYNMCSLDSFYSVPNQGGYNFQNAYSGNAFIGLYLYNGINNNYREYAHIQLISSLQINKCYYVEFFVNRASETFGGKYAINNIACSFTNSEYNSTGNVLNLIPYVYKLGNPIIYDTINWTKVSGIYIASGGEQYITIGNFKNDSTTDTLNTGNGIYPGSYYFIDDVSVIPVDSLSMPAFAGNDISINAGDSAFIGQEITNLNCNWYILGGAQIAGNISGLYVKPTVNTTYVVEQDLCDNISYDTVMVKVNNTGIAEYNNDYFDVMVYPNPSTGNVYIEPIGIKSENISITVSDVTGKMVYNTTLVVNEGKCNFSLKAEPGMYLLKVVNNLSKEETIKNLILQ